MSLEVERCRSRPMALGVDPIRRLGTTKKDHKSTIGVAVTYFDPERMHYLDCSGYLFLSVAVTI